MKYRANKSPAMISIFEIRVIISFFMVAFWKAVWYTWSKRRGFRPRPCCSLSEQFDQNHNPAYKTNDSDDELFKLVAQLDELFYFAFHFSHLPSLILLYHTDSSMSIPFCKKIVYLCEKTGKPACLYDKRVFCWDYFVLWFCGWPYSLSIASWVTIHCLPNFLTSMFSFSFP